MKENIMSATKFIRVTEYTSPSYDFLELYEEPAVIDHILKRLQILRGTYVFDPEYGSDLLKYLFEPLDGETEAKVKAEVENVISEIPAIEKYEVQLETKQNLKEIIVNIILTFKSGNSYFVQINPNNLTNV